MSDLVRVENKVSVGIEDRVRVEEKFRSHHVATFEDVLSENERSVTQSAEDLLADFLADEIHGWHRVISVYARGNKVVCVYAERE